SALVPCGIWLCVSPQLKNHPPIAPTKLPSQPNRKNPMYSPVPLCADSPKFFLPVGVANIQENPSATSMERPSTLCWFSEVGLPIGSALKSVRNESRPCLTLA